MNGFKGGKHKIFSAPLGNGLVAFVSIEDDISFLNVNQNDIIKYDKHQNLHGDEHQKLLVHKMQKKAMS